MTDIVDDDVIRLARWHENEAVRLRKHPDADIDSTHGLAEMHGETASTLYMLLADRNAAIMDADMQTREAGNMEHNARVLMAERDQLRAALTNCLSFLRAIGEGNTFVAEAACIALGKDRQ
jgi:hypothetical protein